MFTPLDFNFEISSTVLTNAEISVGSIWFNNVSTTTLPKFPAAPVTKIRIILYFLFLQISAEFRKSF